MTKMNELRYRNHELRSRVKELEQLLCPAEDHDYKDVEMYDDGSMRCVCRRCLKQYVRPAPQESWVADEVAV